MKKLNKNEMEMFSAGYKCIYHGLAIGYYFIPYLGQKNTQAFLECLNNSH